MSEREAAKVVENTAKTEKTAHRKNKAYLAKYKKTISKLLDRIQTGLRTLDIAPDITRAETAIGDSRRVAESDVKGGAEEAIADLKHYLQTKVVQWAQDKYDEPPKPTPL